MAGLEGGSHASGQASGQQVVRGGHQGGSKRKSRMPTTANSSHKTGKTNYKYLQLLRITAATKGYDFITTSLLKIEDFQFTLPTC